MPHEHDVAQAHVQEPDVDQVRVGVDVGQDRAYDFRGLIDEVEARGRQCAAHRWRSVMYRGIATG